MEAVNNKRMVILLCISIITVIVATASVTYAYLSVGVEQKEANVLSSACFNITFSNENNKIDYIGYPMSEKTGLGKTPYSFTITNTCDTSNNYKLLLNVFSSSSSELLKYIRFTIDDNTVRQIDESLTTINLPSSFTNGKDSFTSYVLLNGVQIDGTTGSNTKIHNLRIWIDEGAGNEIMEEVFKAQVSVYSGDEPAS